MKKKIFTLVGLAGLVYLGNKFLKNETCKKVVKDVADKTKSTVNGVIDNIFKNIK
jgi:hypothetical protein